MSDKIIRTGLCPGGAANPRIFLGNSVLLEKIGSKKDGSYKL